MLSQSWAIIEHMFDCAATVAGVPDQDTLCDLLTAVLDVLSGADLDEVDSAALGAHIALLHRQTQRLQAERLRRLAAHDRRVAWRSAGARSAKEWLSSACGLTRGEAAGQVQTAQQLSELPATSARLAAGEMTLGQARVVTSTASRAPVADRAELDRMAAETVDQGTDTGRLRTAVDDWAHRCDARLLADRREAAYRRRSATFGRGGDGSVTINARMDPLSGEMWLTAMEALSAPAGEADARTPEQRRADAMAELARRGLDSGDLPLVGGQRPHVTVTVDVATLQGLGGGPPPRFDYGGAVCTETARMLACDAAVTRVIMAGVSQPLDVGRASRTVTAAQRRALITRDGCCRGCGAPPGWCVAHHIVHWVNGGATDLANLALLCWTCHDNVHHRGWTLKQDSDRRWTLQPPASLGRQPISRLRTTPAAPPRTPSPSTRPGGHGGPQGPSRHVRRTDRPP